MMQNETKLIHIDWIENKLEEPTLLLHLTETPDTYSLFSDAFLCQWPASFLLSIAIEEWETEQHADFTVTQFIFNDIICLLTINTISDSIWITALTRPRQILTALKNHIEEVLQ